MLKVKDVKGFEEYTIDTEGNVFSKRKNRYLKATVNKHGYCKVKLFKNNYGKIYSVHRLVAEAFIPNPENKPQVNHIDSNRRNNNIENLEWVTNKENMQHAVRNNRFANMAKINSEKMKKNAVYLTGYLKANEKWRRKVNKCNENGEILGTYESMVDAERKTGICAQGINQVCRGKRKRAGGYIWHYA